MKKLDGIGKAGAIYTIVSAGLSALIWFVFLGLFAAVPLAICILAIVFNAKVLKGTAASKTAAVVFGFLTSLLGGILLLVGKYE